PPPLALGEIVIDPHRNGGADPCETVDQNPDQRPIPQTDERVSRDPIEELTRLLGRQNRRLAALNNMLGSAHDRGRVAAHHLADDQPVIEHPDRREVLLDTWRSPRLAELLDIASDMD